LGCRLLSTHGGRACVFQRICSWIGPSACGKHSPPFQQATASIIASENGPSSSIPPTPPTHLNLQEISLFSRKLGSVGGLVGRWGAGARGVPGLLRVNPKGEGRWRTAKMTDESDPSGLPPLGPSACEFFDTLGLRGQRPWNLRIFGAKAFRPIILRSLGHSVFGRLHLSSFKTVACRFQDLRF
jgi:hypothetical protein